jgi:hypothetical protein
VHGDVEVNRNALPSTPDSADLEEATKDMLRAGSHKIAGALAYLARTSAMVGSTW